MKNQILVAICVFCCFAYSASQSYADERSKRRGFVIGFDVGGGGIRFGNGSREGAFLGGLKIGGGLNERVLLLAEDSSAISFVSGTPSIEAFYFASQVFVMKNFYVRPGVGFGFGEEDVVGGGTFQTDLGFATGLATGYEWRLTKRFALSPEAKGGYARLQGRNYFTFGAVIDLRWYF